MIGETANIKWTTENISAATELDSIILFKANKKIFSYPIDITSGETDIRMPNRNSQIEFIQDMELPDFLQKALMAAAAVAFAVFNVSCASPVSRIRMHQTAWLLSPLY